MKTRFSAELMLYPCPVVLVTTKYGEIENVFTVAWTGIASSHPEMVTIAVNTTRYSHFIIKKSKRFCINIPNADLIKSVDYCGSFSGRNIDKFKECGFTKQYIYDYILIDECPFSIVCDVQAEYNLGSHTLFLGEVRGKFFDETCANLDPLSYIRPYYYRLGKDPLGEYGYTKL